MGARPVALALADLIDRHADELAKLDTRDMGMPYLHSRQNWHRTRGIGVDIGLEGSESYTIMLKSVIVDLSAQPHPWAGRSKGRER